MNYSNFQLILKQVRYFQFLKKRKKSKQKNKSKFKKKEKTGENFPA